MGKHAIACLTLIVLLAGCSSEKRVVVGAKNFTEQNVLGEIVAQHVENRLHQPVKRMLNLGGTLLAYKAILAGDIDVYPEYTGTAYTNVLKRTPIADPPLVLAQLRSVYKASKLEWLDPLGFNNSYAMVVRGEDARARRLQTLTDAANDPAGFELGAGFEFQDRPDGYRLLTSNYAIKWKANPKSMDLSLLYQALLQKQVDLVAASATDGILAVMDFKVLQDDKKIFPPYQACLVARTEALALHPGLRGALTQLSGKLSEDTIRKLNYEVDGKHRPVPDVAREFLKVSGL